MITTRDIKDKNENDLVRMLADKKQSLWKFRLGVAGGKTRDVKEGRELRRDIAKILSGSQQGGQHQQTVQGAAMGKQRGGKLQHPGQRARERFFQRLRAVAVVEVGQQGAGGDRERVPERGGQRIVAERGISG